MKNLLGMLYLCFMFIYCCVKANQLDEHFKLLVYGLVLAIAFGSTANSLLMDTTEGHFFVYFTAVLLATSHTNHLGINRN